VAWVKVLEKSRGSGKLAPFRAARWPRSSPNLPEPRPFGRGLGRCRFEAVVPEGPRENASLFRELLGLLASRGVTVRTEVFHTAFDRAGGYCQLFGQNLVLLDARASEAEQVRALIESMESIGLDTLGIRGSDLSPNLLRTLNGRGHMPWPHKTQAPALARAMERIDRDRQLAPFTTLGTGGPALRFVRVSARLSLVSALLALREEKLPVLVLGGGSNLVVSDRGVRASVIAMNTRGLEWRPDGESVLVSAQAGEPWDAFVAETVARDLTGLECLSGIPGHVGATPIQNVGAYGQEVSEAIEFLSVLDTLTGEELTVSKAECEFGYRDSFWKRAQRGRYIVLDVTFRLFKGRAPELRYEELRRTLGSEPSPSLSRVREAVLALRKTKSMVVDPNDENRRSCGSFFVNPFVSGQELEWIAQASQKTPPHFAEGPDRFKVPAAWLIEQSGLARGSRQGPVGLSTRHTLALVAHSGATSADIVRFAHGVRSRVEEKFRVRLRPEPEFWGYSEFDDGLPSLTDLD
jgi:UDP-N-acetylmuramate dehydrogenase